MNTNEPAGQRYSSPSRHGGRFSRRSFVGQPLDDERPWHHASLPRADRLQAAPSTQTTAGGPLACLRGGWNQRSGRRGKAGGHVVWIDTATHDGEPAIRAHDKKAVLQVFSSSSNVGGAARLLPEPRKLCLRRQQKRLICRQITKAGATGLEPATSGVTGQFEYRDMHNGSRSIGLVLRDCGVVVGRLRMVERSDLERLLPVGCPS
jgi:hypothetical protein